MGDRSTKQWTPKSIEHGSAAQPIVIRDGWGRLTEEPSHSQARRPTTSTTSTTYPQPRRVVESRSWRRRGISSADGGLRDGELAGEACESALAGVASDSPEQRPEEVSGLHEVSATGLVGSRRGQQPRGGARCLPRARLKQDKKVRLSKSGKATTSTSVPLHLLVPCFT